MNKNIIFGIGVAIGGFVLGVITDHIATKDAVDKATKTVEETAKNISKEQMGILAVDTEELIDLANKAMDDQDEVIKAQGLKIQALENELKKYDNEDFKEWMRLKETFKVNKGTYGEWLLERDKQKKRQHEEDIVKKAIEEKDWTTVYNKTEGWYNKYPVQMGRYEVFRYLEQDEYVTDEQVKEARDYFGSLWNYVGD